MYAKLGGRNLMNSSGNQNPLATEEPLIEAIPAFDEVSELVEGQGNRAVHPARDGIPVTPTGNYPQAVVPKQAPHPARAGVSDAETEIISALPDPDAARKRRKRNRKAIGPVKLLALFLAAQVVIGFFVFAIFGSAIRSWLIDSVRDPDGVSAADAEALRVHIEEATAGFEKFDRDLALVKKQIAVSPGDAWAELDILGKRNQLTMHADDAIANGTRASFDRLLALSGNEDIEPQLRDGAAAEILRVKDFYASGTRLGSYSLPVGTLYPSLKSKNEEALDTSVLLALLGDQERTWRQRTRAAYLLAGRRSLIVAEALVQAAKSDPNLDVVKECVFTFQENTGFRASGLFEIEELLTWWDVYEARVSVAEEEESPDPG